MFIGEVLSIISFLWWPWPLYSSWLFVGLCPFGNKFLIIQKKKGDERGDERKRWENKRRAKVEGQPP